MSTEASQVGEGWEYVQHGVVVTVENYRVCAHLKRGVVTTQLQLVLASAGLFLLYFILKKKIVTWVFNVRPSELLNWQQI